ncbi:MAG TPA: L,D-transpeptidase [Thermoleophilaceae bacterium]|nr:L,D-transpeptidase [Thermoleophilaceae bacterium]
MRKLATGVAAAALLVTSAWPAAAQSQPPPVPAPGVAPQPAPTIATGVRAGGVGVGGLTVEQATAKLTTALGPRLRSPITVRVARKRFRVRPRRLGLRFDAARTARRALKAGLGVDPELGEPVFVPVVVRFSHKRLRGYVSGLARRVYVAPRNATLRITVRRMVRRRSYGGRKLVEYRLRAAIARVLREPRARRAVTGQRRRLRPAVTYRGLARRYPTVVTIDRGGFRLRLFKRLRYDRSYPIAVGAAGYDTPTGLFQIRTKQVNPAWHAPNRPWAGSYAGRTVPGGAPDNPLKARWLGIASGVGIHGTAEPWSIGSRASHGCIRMRVPDVIDLYRRVPVGAPTLIR